VSVELYDRIMILIGDIVGAMESVAGGEAGGNVRSVGGVDWCPNRCMLRANLIDFYLDPKTLELYYIKMPDITVIKGFPFITDRIYGKDIKRGRMSAEDTETVVGVLTSAINSIKPHCGEYFSK